jgi:drug/metabolite transporter (DMT)-like permease
VFLIAMPKAARNDESWGLFDVRLVLLVVIAAWAGGRLTSLRAGPGSPMLALPGLLLFAGTALYSGAAARGQLAIVSAAASLAPVLTVSLSVSLTGERMSRSQMVGVATALSGIVLVAT